MSPDPCFSDTCSVDLEFDGAGPGLTADVKLHDLGAIECRDTGDDPGEEGLWVRVFGDPAAIDPAALTECDNLLGRTTDNDLFARRPQFERFVIDPNNVFDVPVGTTVVDLGESIQNNADCDRLLIVRTKFQINASVTSGMTNRFFQADFTFQLLFDGNSQYTLTQVIEGIAPAVGSRCLVKSWMVTSHHLLAAGDCFDVDVEVRRDNPVAAGDYDATLDTTGAGACNGDNGINTAVSCVAIDLGPGNIVNLPAVCP